MTARCAASTAACRGGTLSADAARDRRFRGGSADIELRSEAAKDITTAAHFAYGALMGAMISAMNPRPSKPTGGGPPPPGDWLASYMGWIPAVGTLEPATRHRAGATR